MLVCEKPRARARREVRSRRKSRREDVGRRSTWGVPVGGYVLRERLQISEHRGLRGAHQDASSAHDRDGRGGPAGRDGGEAEQTQKDRHERIVCFPRRPTGQSRASSLA